MKVLHAALMSTPQIGVLRQMTWEAQAARELGLPWRSAVFGSASVADLDPALVVRACGDPKFERGRNSLAAVRRWLAWRASFYRWLAVQSEQVDLLLLRHTLHDPLRPLAIGRIQIPVYSVHHTLEVPEMKACGRRKSAMAEAILGRASLRQSFGIVAVTPEILDHEGRRRGTTPPGYVYPNGTLVPGGFLEGVVPWSPAPELLFMADHFLPWHGLDRLLADMAMTARPLRLHVVGTLDREDEEGARRDPRVELHGHLPEEKIQALLDRCSVGIASLALDRIGITQACTLKVREYLRQGLPVYAGHSDVIPTAYPYLRTGTPSINEILNFASEVAGTERKTVRDEAAPFIDKRSLLAGLYDWLDDQH